MCRGCDIINSAIRVTRNCRGNHKESDNDKIICNAYLLGAARAFNAMGARVYEEQVSDMAACVHSLGFEFAVEAFKSANADREEGHA